MLDALLPMIKQINFGLVGEGELDGKIHDNETFIVTSNNGQLLRAINKQFSELVSAEKPKGNKFYK